MMLQQMLRPVQKQASRLLLAGTGKVDVREHVQGRPAEVQGPPVLYTAQGEVPRIALPASPARQAPAWQVSRLAVEAQEPAVSEEPAFYGEGGYCAEAQQEMMMSQQLDAAGAQCDGVARWPVGWPVGSMVLPVFWPVMPVAAHQQQCWGAPVEVSGPMLDAATSSGSASVDAAVAEQATTSLPGRTGASRRQRRKQRSALMAAACSHTPQISQAPATPGALEQQPQPQLQQLQRQPQPSSAAADAEAPGQLQLRRLPSTASLEEDSGPSMLWPPTPESSPALSPMAAAFLPDFALPQPARPSGAPAPPPSLPAAASAAQLQDAELESVAAQLVAGDADARGAVLAWLADGAAWPLALMPSGCRLVQQALEVAEGPEQAAMAEQLRGRVREASMSPHANHVLQKVIELMPPDRLSFVLQEMTGHSVNAARHRYGCRVLERLIEHCPSWQTDDLVEELMVAASTLCRHTFGNFVVQHVLEHGTQPQRKRISEVLYTDVQRLARHRVASHVVRSALVHCSPDDRSRLVDAMRADAGELSDLAHHHCGSFVVREMRRELRK